MSEEVEKRAGSSADPYATNPLEAPRPLPQSSEESVTEQSGTDDADHLSRLMRGGFAAHQVCATMRSWQERRYNSKTMLLKVAKAHAARHRLTLGQAVSEMVRKAAERRLITEERSGLQVIHLRRRSPKVTAAIIDRLRQDLP